MSAESIILRGREFLEGMMTSACTISRTSAPIFNESTGEYDATSTLVYSGPCRLKQGNTQVSQVEAAGQLLISQDSILSLPVATSGAVREDDVATITANELDPALVGLKFRVKAGHSQTNATARRLPVELVS